MLKQYAVKTVQTFEEYWKLNKVMLENWGVSKQVAHIIWTEAINAMHNVVMEKLLTEITNSK
jgi:uncharacterized membrane protein